MEAYYSLPGGMESLIERTEHSLMEMEFFFKTTQVTNAQTEKIARHLLTILQGKANEQGN